MTEHATSEQLRRLERQIRRQLDVKVASRRVWESVPAIVQILVAVSVAYAAARWGLGHPIPLLAVTVTINSLGFSRDARPRRVLESVSGILLGIALADALALVMGRGPWELIVVLAVVFVVGRAVSANPAFAVAAAVPSAIVTLIPPSAGPFSLFFDGLIGGATALLVTALVPRNPRRTAAHDGRTLFSLFDESLASLEDCLNDADEAAGELALTRLRRTQPVVDAWSTSLDSAIAVSRISPFLRGQLPELRRTAQVQRAGDLAARHLRTIARRAEFLVRDGRVRPELGGVIAELRAALAVMGSELTRTERKQVGADVTDSARDRLTTLGHRLDPAVVVPGAGLTDAALLLLLRPLVVDLLVGTGMPVDAARAQLPGV